MSRDTWADVYNEDMSCEQLPLPDNLADAHRTIRELQRQIERMQRQLEQLLRQRHGPKSEKHHNEQLLLFGESAVELPPASPQPEPNAKVGHGRQKLPASLPRQEIVHDLTPEQKLCPECGIERQPMGEESSEQLEYIPASLKVLVHRRPKYACADCQGHVAVAARLPEPIERGLPGVGLLAHVIVSKFMDHLPLYRQERIFQRQGVSLSRQTTCGWLAQCAGLLEPIWKAMKAADLALEGRDDRRHNGAGARSRRERKEPHRAVLGLPRRSRPPVRRLRLLDRSPGGLAGSLLEGLHVRLSAIGRLFGLRPAPCAGARRGRVLGTRAAEVPRRELQRQDSGRGVLDWIGRLYGVERAVKGEVSQRLSTLGREPSDVERQAMDDQVRAEARDKNSREILNGFSLWLESRVVQVLPKSPMGEAIGYARSNWQALNRYLEAPWLSIDNNASERAIRPIAIGRKNSYDRCQPSPVASARSLRASAAGKADSEGGTRRRLVATVDQTLIRGLATP